MFFSKYPWSGCQTGSEDRLYTIEPLVINYTHLQIKCKGLTGSASESGTTFHAVEFGKNNYPLFGDFFMPGFIFAIQIAGPQPTDNEPLGIGLENGIL
jgi:hypothetical protein